VDDHTANLGAMAADRLSDLFGCHRHQPFSDDGVSDAGHFHGGQICVPSPWGRLRLKDFRAAYWEGVFETSGGLLHVSRGLGTSFVPFRLFARPEATLLTLRAA